MTKQGWIIVLVTMLVLIVVSAAVTGQRHKDDHKQEAAAELPDTHPLRIIEMEAEKLNTKKPEVTEPKIQKLSTLVINRVGESPIQQVWLDRDACIVHTFGIKASKLVMRSQILLKKMSGFYSSGCYGNTLVFVDLPENEEIFIEATVAEYADPDKRDYLSLKIHIHDLTELGGHLPNLASDFRMH